jgi:membrane protein
LTAGFRGLVRDLKESDWAHRSQRLQATVPGRVVAKFIDDQAANWAVQIAWYALLSMFPILLAAAGVLGFIFSLAGIGGEDVRRNLAAVIPAGDAQQQVVTAVEQFKQASGLLALVGFAGLLIGGSTLFSKMDVAFAAAYGVKPRRLVSQRVMSVGMVFVFTALVGLDIGSALLLPVLKGLAGYIPLAMTRGAVGLVAQLFVGTVLSFAFFATTYYVVPNRKIKWREVVPGALVAGVLLELVTLVFPLYVSLNSSLQRYGQTFGLLFVLMTFFFFLGLIMMVGVEVNSVVHPTPEPRPSSGVHKKAAGKVT